MTNAFCQYNKIFGEPNTGVHQYRIFNIAIVDVIITFVLAYILTLFNPQFEFKKTSLILFLLGIFFHRLFCVKTNIDKILFN